MTDKRNFINEVEQQIDTRNGEIVKFRVIAEVAEPDDQIEFYQIIEEIVEKENVVKEKLAAFAESDAADQASVTSTLKCRK